MRAQSSRDKETVTRAQSVRDKGTVVRAQSVRDKDIRMCIKGQRVRPRSKEKTMLLIYVCKKTSPGQRVGCTTRKTSCKKLDVTQLFSIVDSEFKQRNNSHNNQLYRSESGEITW